MVWSGCNWLRMDIVYMTPMGWGANREETVFEAFLQANCIILLVSE
jgi:hypothetical protein